MAERMTNRDAIKRWAEFIIPTVFKAETELQRSHPDWVERLKVMGESSENPTDAAKEYCLDIAKIIVRNAEDYDPSDTSDRDM